MATDDMFFVIVIEDMYMVKKTLLSVIEHAYVTPLPTCHKI